MGRFFTSDHHFGHENILRYAEDSRRDAEGRKFRNVEKMNEYIIEHWNEHISEDDTVYCLGDLCFKMSVLDELMPQLNGEIILIVGNHDPFFKQSTRGELEEARKMAVEMGFKELHLEHLIEIDGVGIVQLSHFPYWPRDISGLPDYDLRFESNRPHQGGEDLLLHGHVHSKWRISRKEGTPMINVGVDVWNMLPVSEAEIVAEFARSDKAIDQ